MKGKHEKKKNYPRLWRLASRLLVLPLVFSLSAPARQSKADRLKDNDNTTGEFRIIDISPIYEKPPRPIKVSKPKPKPKPKIRRVIDRGRLVLAIGRRYIGRPYVWGGNGPSVFDCSGLTKFLYHRVGVTLPRVSRDQAAVGRRVFGLSNARPGDLIFFGSPVHHVSIYAGNGMMLDAPHSGSFVQLRPVYTTPTIIRRIL